MSTDITVYDDTGRITFDATLSDATFDYYVASGVKMALHVRADTATQYVLNGEILARPPNTAALAGHVVSGIPVPSTLTINGASFDVDEATVELDLPDIGSYRITIDSWPHLPATLEIRV